MTRRWRCDCSASCSPTWYGCWARPPDTLSTRNNIAHWTGQIGDPALALRLFRELLPDLVRVLGPDHPATLTTRNNIAGWTGQAGDPAGALRLSQELLPTGAGAGSPTTPTP